jgi:hypothetical protein
VRKHSSDTPARRSALVNLPIAPARRSGLVLSRKVLCFAHDCKDLSESSLALTKRRRAALRLRSGQAALQTSAAPLLPCLLGSAPSCFRFPWPPWRPIATLPNSRIESTHWKQRTRRNSNRHKNAFSGKTTFGATSKALSGSERSQGQDLPIFHFHSFSFRPGRFAFLSPSQPAHSHARFDKPVLYFPPDWNHYSAGRRPGRISSSRLRAFFAAGATPAPIPKPCGRNWCLQVACCLFGR